MNIGKMLMKTGLIIQKYSPQILAVVGTVSTIAGVVAACKTSGETAEDVAEAKEAIQQIEESIDKEAIDEKDGKKAIREIRRECFVKVAPKYILAIVLLLVGIGSLHASRLIVSYWLNGTSAAYISLENRYQMLEDGVRREYGEEALERLKYGVYEDLGETRIVSPDGTETSLVEPYNDLVDGNKVGGYTFIMDKTSSRYISSADHLISYLKNTQEHTFSALLRKNGALSLWTVCKMLDIRPRSFKEYMFMRDTFWIYDASDPNADCNVDLRARVLHDANTKNYKNGYEPIVVIDPNWDFHVSDGNFERVYKAMR